MKQIILSLSYVLFGVGVACASPDRPIKQEQLPATAQEFLKESFAQVAVASAFVDGDLMCREYDVVLEDGTKIEFASNGQWLQVQSRSALPRGIVPSLIETYVARHYPSLTITRVERSRAEWEVELSNGVELKFDKRLRLVDIDD